MKIAILGDTHFGVRGDSIAFHNSYKNFYKEVFFPYLVQHGITTVFQLGDLFDRRKYISFQSLALCRRYFFDEFPRYNIELHTLLGNHDITYRNTLEVNSPELLLREYENHIFVYNEPYSWNGIDVIPWICKNNELEILDFIRNSKNEMCFGHFELAGFKMDLLNLSHEGMDPATLKKYELVLSGHYHHKSTQGNITYVGTPNEMTWLDYNDPRGFHILDTQTRELEFIENPFKMFYKINYNDDLLDYEQLVNKNYNSYSGKYVKIIVEKRNNTFLFDTLLDNLTKVNPADVSIVEDFTDIDIANSDMVVDEAQDTISILNSYIDSLTLPVESNRIKDIVREVYAEALINEAA